MGFILRAAFGTSTVADGLLCIPTSPASMSVSIGPGSILFNTTVDTLAAGFGSLPLDTADTLMKIGTNLTTTTIGPFTAPSSAGQSQNFLIEASFAETDGSPVVLPYYNSANPAIPFGGPANTGAAQNTIRTQTVSLQVKAGVAATTGSQTTPAPDIGWIGLWVVTIANGTATLLAGNINPFPGAPFIPEKLGVGSLFGYSNLQTFGSSTTWVVPNGVTSAKVTVTGAGGGSSGCNPASHVGASGGGGGTALGVVALTPGTSMTITVGTAGAGAAALSTAASGTASSFGALIGNGGQGAGASGVNGGVGGGASGGQLNLRGGDGSDGSNVANGDYWPGLSGSSYWAGGRRAAVNAAQVGGAPGVGGGAPYTLTTQTVSGTFGGNGVVTIEW